MKFNGTRTLTILMFIAIAVGLGPEPSQARSIPASAGRGVNAADHNCFAFQFHTMKNTCNTNRVLEIPLTIDATPSWYAVTVTAQGAFPDYNVGCKTWGVDKNGTAFTSSEPRKYLDGFGSPQDLTTSGWVPADGGLYVNCDVSPGGQVNMVNW